MDQILSVWVRYQQSSSLARPDTEFAWWENDREIFIWNLILNDYGLAQIWCPYWGVGHHLIGRRDCIGHSRPLGWIFIPPPPVGDQASPSISRAEHTEFVTRKRSAPPIGQQ